MGGRATDYMLFGPVCRAAETSLALLRRPRPAGFSPVQPKPARPRLAPSSQRDPLEFQQAWQTPLVRPADSQNDTDSCGVFVESELNWSQGYTADVGSGKPVWTIEEKLRSRDLVQ